MEITAENAWLGVPEGGLAVRTWAPAVAAEMPPIVLLHDSIGCIQLWRDYPQVLSERTGRRVLAYDRLGFGQSSSNPFVIGRGFIEGEYKTVERLLDHFELEQCALYGYSVGGSMSLCAAAALGGRVTHVISEATQSFVEEYTLEGVRKAKDQFSDPALFARLAKYHGEKTQWVLNSWTETWLDPGYRDWSLAPVLPKVACPVLVMHGDRDDYATMAQPELIYSMVPKCRLEKISECGHMPHREHRETVIGLVTEFLGEE